MKNILFLMMLLLTNAALYAQETSGIEMADTMRSSGKIYVVITVIAIIFIGLAVFLFSIDRRLKKLEK